jgi:hypothetical protein
VGQFETGSPPETATDTRVDKRAAHLEPYRWRKGQAGNPSNKNRARGRLLKRLKGDADKFYDALIAMVADRNDPDHFPAVKLGLIYLLGKPRSMDAAAVEQEVQRQLMGLMAEAQRARAERAGAGEPAR